MKKLLSNIRFALYKAVHKVVFDTTVERQEVTDPDTIAELERMLAGESTSFRRVE